MMERKTCIHAPPGGPVVIAANLDALIALRHAIQDALDQNIGVAEVSAPDGQVFKFVVRRLDGSLDWEQMAKGEAPLGDPLVRKALG